jgi:hypothetical protein
MPDKDGLGATRQARQDLAVPDGSDCVEPNYLSSFSIVGHIAPPNHKNDWLHKVMRQVAL